MAEHFGWNQIFDRKHITTKIVLNWGGLDNPDKFRDDVHQILNETDQEEVSLLIEAAISEHTQPKAQAFLEKISENPNKICFAYTHRHFTAGHVADQRGESLNGVIKTGGMKKLLVKSTFPETYQRLMTVARNTNLACRQELELLRRRGQTSWREVCSRS